MARASLFLRFCIVLTCAMVIMYVCMSQVAIVVYIRNSQGPSPVCHMLQTAIYLISVTIRKDLKIRVKIYNIR